MSYNITKCCDRRKFSKKNIKKFTQHVCVKITKFIEESCGIVWFSEDIGLKASKYLQVCATKLHPDEN